MPEIVPDDNTSLLYQRWAEQSKEIASLKTQVQELQSSLRTIELRLAPIEMERRRYC